MVVDQIDKLILMNNEILDEAAIFEKSNMKLRGTIILTIVTLFERLSYYGIRSILILYAVDPNRLNIDRVKSLEYYGYWTVAIVIAAIPFSLITDKFLGQKKSITVGGLLSLFGYLLMLIESQYVLLLSLILILAGTSLVKPSTTILIGRQFKKENKDRTLAYIVFFVGINLGSFLGALGIGYVGQAYKWEYGFMIAAASTLLYLLVINFAKDQIQEIETNKLATQNIGLTINRTVLILPLLILVYIVFWKSLDLEMVDLLSGLINSEFITFLGGEYPVSILPSLSVVWTIPFTIFIFIYWYIKGVTRIWNAISVALLLLSVAIIFSLVLQILQLNPILGWAIIPIALFAFAEVLISPVLTSYVTRISDVNYSNTIYSAFILLTYALGAGFIYLVSNDYQSYILLVILTATVGALLFFKKQIVELTYGLE